MKRKLLICTLMIIGLLSVILSGCRKKYTPVAIFQYEENEDGTVTITGLTDKGKTETEIVVPSSLDDKQVKAIGSGAIRDNVQLKKVVIEEGITSISSNAFLSDYNLTEIEFPSTLKEIGSNAFTETTWLSRKQSEGNEIIVNNILVMVNETGENYTVPEGIEAIAEGAFYSNNALIKVKFSSTVKIIGNYAFYGCSSLTDVELNEGLESIGYCAFADSGLKSVNLPASVRTLGKDAFLNVPDVTYGNGKS